ncbi:LVIVD repeat-containing protein [Haloferax sp. S1W]|uniref:LVIVD repeat-containing protein n=1 Tax=Haloferax sp. S1W TaxID=3377110 RepID=UPI0037CBB859
MDRRHFLQLTGGALLAGTAGPTRRAAAHPGPFEPLGSVDIEGAKEAVLSADGKTAFVAATTGYATVDISTPDRPTLLAERRDRLSDREDGPLRGIFDVKRDGDTLLVVGPANPIPGAPSGVLVVDVSDPSDPVERAFYETDFPIHNCFAADGRAYLTANDGEKNPLVVLDIDTGDELGRWSLVSEDSLWAEVGSSVRAIHDLWVHDDVVFIAHWDAGTWIVDVSDPTAPTTIGAISPGNPEDLVGLSGRQRRLAGRTPPGNHHYVATDDSGTLLGIGIESWAVEVERTETTGQDNGTTTPTTELVGGPGGVELWDISDLTTPTRLSTIDPPASPDPTQGGVWTTAHNFDFHDGRLYTSWYRGGVKRHDVSDPSDPVELAWWRDPERTNFWTAQYAYPFADEGVFAASSWGFGDVPGALYTFPDHAGEQLNPPTLGPETTTESLVNTPTGTPTPTHGSSPQTETPTSTTDIPGFGLGVGAAALGGAGLWYRRHSRRED